MTCKHYQTQANKCVDCGVLVSKVETKPCGECDNFKLDSGANVLGVCKPKLITVTSSMLVTFKVKDGTCFVPLTK